MEPQAYAGPHIQPVNTAGWVLLVSLCGGGAGLAILLTAALCHLVRQRQFTHSDKKSKATHNFGVKKQWTQQERTALNLRKPTPVANPDKGSHYLRKSPSPTGSKSPPGGEEVSLPSVEECLQGKALITMEQQTEPSPTIIEESIPCIPEIKDELNEDGSNLGKLYFTVRYSFEKNALVVTINKCTNLPAKDSANKTSDPYVKLQLLPEKQHKVKTRVVRRTLHPVYDEDFTFYGVHFNQLPILTLHFVVLSFDRYSRDDVIGEVMVELEQLPKLTGPNSDNSPLALSREITPRSEKLRNQGRGELLVSLCFQPAATRVTVVVLKARNLPKMDITGLSDPYVKIYLIYNGQRISKKKTHVKKRTLNPVFNESFVFDLPKTDAGGLGEFQLEFLLLDWDRVTKNEVIGRLELGGEGCTEAEQHHWKEIQASPRRQIAEWHKLRE